MINRIIFPENYNLSDIMLFSEADLTMLPDRRIVPLFGPNGAGKTTILSALSNTLYGKLSLEHLLSQKDTDEFSASFYKEENKKKDEKKGCILKMDKRSYKVLCYKNSTDNYRIREARSYMESFNPYLLNARFDAQSLSEGQSIIYSIWDLFDILKPGKDMVSVSEGDVIVLIDEMDSGLSIDNIDMFMKRLRNILKKRNDVQFFISFNNPRILKYFPYVLSMYDGNVLEMHSDEDMIAEIRKHKKSFDKARKKSDGRPKVFE